MKSKTNNQEFESSVSATLQMRSARTKRKRNSIMKAIGIVLFIISMLPVSNLIANEAERPIISGTEFYNSSLDLDKSNDSLEFYIDYMLDEDGKPYIISIKSRSEKMTHMVKKMINAEQSNFMEEDGEWYIITFLYDQIQ